MTLSLADRTKIISIFNTLGDLHLTTAQIDAASSVSANIPTILKYIYQKYHIDTSDFTSQNFLAPINLRKNQKFIERSLNELNENYNWEITPDLISKQAARHSTLSQILAALGRNVAHEHNFPILTHNVKRLSSREAEFARNMYQQFLLSPTARKMEHRAFDYGYVYRGALADPTLGEIGIDHNNPQDAAALNYAQTITSLINTSLYSDLQTQCKNGAFTQNQFILCLLNLDAQAVLFRISAALEMRHSQINSVCDNKAYLQITSRYDLTENEKLLMVKAQMLETGTVTDTKLPIYDYYAEQYKRFHTPNSWNVPRP